MKQNKNDRSSSSSSSGSLPDIAVTTVTGRKMNGGGFSFVVNDVDAHSILQETLGGAGGMSSASSTSSLDGQDELHERVKKIQVEAEARRWEFALLLEEHAQVVRKLKRMEAEEQMYLSSARAEGLEKTHA